MYLRDVSLYRHLADGKYTKKSLLKGLFHYSTSKKPCQGDK